MLTEAIILAGGLGTRLQQAVPELPKCLAPVNGKPFIQYVVDHLAAQGIDRIILSLGYRSEQVMDYFDTHPQGVTIAFSVEEEPLGTGGGISLALRYAEQEQVLIVNGDTLSKANAQELFEEHEANEAVCTLSLKPMRQFSRYGSVVLEDDNRISSFREKTYCEEGLINAGVYILNKERFSQYGFPEKFSFEKDFLERYCPEGVIYGFIQDEYFIDIGVPEDYERAQVELE